MLCDGWPYWPYWIGVLVVGYLLGRSYRCDGVGCEKHQRAEGERG